LREDSFLLGELRERFLVLYISGAFAPIKTLKLAKYTAQKIFREKGRIDERI
jgi:hypothetical protein